MRAFQYCVPTKIIFGPAAESQCGQACLEQEAKRVLVLYGGGSAVRSGLIDRVKSALEGAGIACFLKGGVQPNPLMEFAAQTVAEYAAQEIGLVLAVGGGSVMDTAKAVAIGLTVGEAGMQDVFRGRAQPPARVLGVGAVVTIAASGSETSPTAVLSDGQTHEKLVCTSPCIVPRFAVLNPELTYTTPPVQTACGVADIMMHTLERYCSDPGGNEITDALAEALLRTVAAQGRVCLERPEDYQARSEILWCGSLSHNGLTGLGRDNQFPVHRLGHELAGRYNIPHGMSLTIMWPAWASRVWPMAPGRFARLGRTVFGLTGEDEGEIARQAVAAFTDYFRALGLPTCFGQGPMGVEQPQVLEQFALNCTDGKTHGLGNLCALDYDGILEVYRLANR